MANMKEPNAVQLFLAKIEAEGHSATVVRSGDSWILQAHRDGFSGLRWIVRPSKSGVYLGAQINKGLDRSALGYSPSVRLVMQKPWAWMMEVPKLVSSIQDWEDAEVTLGLANGMEPGFVPDSSAYRHIFAWKLNQGRLQLLRPIYDASAAGEIAEDETLEAVIAHVKSLPEYRWLWARLGWGQIVATDTAVVETTIRDMITRFGAWYTGTPKMTNS